MKILIFCPYYPPHLGGLENYTDELNKYLAKKKIRVTVFTPHLPSDCPERESRHETIEIIRFPAFEVVSNFPLPKFWCPTFWKLFASLFKEDFDVIISQTRFFFTSVIALFYAKTKKKKWFNIEHGSAFVKLSSSFTNAVAKMYDLTLGRMVLVFSNGNISISEAVQKFIKKFDKRNSPVIYRGLDLERIEQTPEHLELKDQHKDKIIISYVGRLYKWKGVENTIKAVLDLPAEIRDNVIFIVAGGGEDFEHLNTFRHSSILLLNSTPVEQAIGLLKISDIYVHSAYPGGGLSTSLLEAMFCKCAIIATKNEGADEVIKDGENGILIEESDPEIITKKIAELYLSRKKRENYSENARRTIEQHFDWNINAQKYLDYFEKHLAK